MTDGLLKGDLKFKQIAEGGPNPYGKHKGRHVDIPQCQNCGGALCVSAGAGGKSVAPLVTPSMTLLIVV